MQDFKKKRDESAIQFDELWDKHNDPEEREKRRILDIRKKRAENKKRELGF